jgi:hypothetical protein
MGLLAIWAALGRRHWFLRTAAVGGVLFWSAVVPAFELVQLFLSEVIFPPRLTNHRQERTCS